MQPAHDEETRVDQYRTDIYWSPIAAFCWRCEMRMRRPKACAAATSATWQSEGQATDGHPREVA